MRGLEHHRALSVPPGRAGVGVRRDEETPVVVRSEQGGKARAVVESRDAPPIDRAVARDERGGTTVAEERIVLEWRRPVAGTVDHVRTLPVPRVASCADGNAT